MIKDCKVIPGESLTAQHRILVAELLMKRSIKVKKDRIPRIRWHRLDREEGHKLVNEIKDEMTTINNDNNAETTWNAFQSLCNQKAAEHLGVSKGPLSNDKDAKWWNGDVRVKVARKKTLFKQWQQTNDAFDNAAYKEAKKEAKRAHNVL
ncbi:uncharacterized protein LOC133525827 [Cydia pomonella]|uniref:uncharacterized protein LOC133525827 n=1 Tax=Cydia pomonella TaxID=82600 RepID=UPI002ADD5409|nr:uncharacterized protein LOC133525827 [Cydia pomonella]